MTALALGLSTGCFYQMRLEACLDVIATMGFRMLEICSFPAHLAYYDPAAVRRVANRLTALGLEPASLHAPFAPHLDITDFDAVQRTRTLQEFLRAVEAAALLGVRYFVMHPGPEQAHRCPQERRQRMDHAVGVLTEVAAHCQMYGIHFLLENMLPHLFAGQTADLLWLLDVLAPLGVGMCLDTGHAHLAGDLPTIVPQCARYVRLLHVHDNRGHFDEHLPVGDGQIAWEPLLRQLAGMQFHGPLIVELAGGGQAHTIVEGAHRAQGYLHALVQTTPQARQPPSSCQAVVLSQDQRGG
jgi:sugar phosphate isomerase/epimerase